MLRNYFIFALLAMVFMGCASKRGNIYDRNGAAIVEHSSKSAVAKYIHPESVSHVVGYTVVDATSHEMVAKQGLEKQYDQQLKSGKDIHTTIDIKLQNAIYALVKDKKGSAVVLDASNGEVLSALSFPSYDINLFTTGMPRNQWNELKKNEDKPFTNRIIHSLYNPGKTLYPLVAYSFLQNGIDAEQKIECETGLEIDLKEALLHKCHDYFYKKSSELGISKLSSAMENFKVGKKTNIDLPNEFSGLLPNTSWKEKRYNTPWYKGDTTMASVGKGYILVTPLQIASYMATVASGRYTQPHLLKNQIDKKEHPSFNQKHLKYIRSALHKNLNASDEYKEKLKNKDRISGVIDTIEQNNTSIFAVYTNDKHYVVVLVLEDEEIQDSFEVFDRVLDVIVTNGDMMH